MTYKPHPETRISRLLDGQCSRNDFGIVYVKVFCVLEVR